MRIGIMGPADSIEIIMAMEADFEPDIDLVPLKAQTLEESAALITTCREQVDGLLFTGCAVYDSAVRAADIKIPHRFVRHTDACLLSLILKEDLQRFKALSIDVIELQVVAEVAEDNALGPCCVQPYESDFTEMEYIAFHDKNLENGTCEAVVTGFSAVYDYYKERGVPVFRLYTTRFEIRNTMSHLVSTIRNNIIDGAKISVQILRLVVPTRNHRMSFDVLEKMLDIEKELLPYLREIQGAIFSDGLRGYIVFTTKGAIQSEKAQHIYRQVVLRSKLPLVSGIGIGLSAAEAELNASIALDHALDVGGKVLFIRDESGRLEGPILGDGPEIARPPVYDAGIAEAVEKTGLSYNYLKKIAGIISLYNRRRFTAPELAHYLGISDRSARRLVKKLMDGGYARVVAKNENPGVGRPQNVVEIEPLHIYPEK